MTWLVEGTSACKYESKEKVERERGIRPGGHLRILCTETACSNILRIRTGRAHAPFPSAGIVPGATCLLFPPPTFSTQRALSLPLKQAGGPYLFGAFMLSRPLGNLPMPWPPSAYTRAPASPLLEPSQVPAISSNRLSGLMGSRSLWGIY